MTQQFQTPFEAGNQNQSTSWAESVAFYGRLAGQFPAVLKMEVAGYSDGGRPIHVGVVSADGQFARERIKDAGRPVFFNNNGIHPGEPEGIDACMALVRDLCVEPARLAALGDAVLLFIPFYSVDGGVNRGDGSRANQDGPEQFGFRGDARNLDLNRDFIKCDSLSTQVFVQLFAAWDPDVMVDTHTSNGADYAYTMTLIHTQADKLGGELGGFLRDTMLPQLYDGMAQRGWPTCPYVNPRNEIPDHGIVDFLETPRFSTGFAALHHTLGFMPETHMLKPFADRYGAMRAMLDTVLGFTVAHAARIQQLRRAARELAKQQREWAVYWKVDEAAPASFRFRGYAAEYRPSVLGSYTRLAYRRDQPWERDIAWYNRFVPDIVVSTPLAYVVPQAWREVIERLAWNGVRMERLPADRLVAGRFYHISRVRSRTGSFEGHPFHDEVLLEQRDGALAAAAGDYWIALDQANARYAIETLEPQAHDSFFRWGFFNSVLEKKEGYSDYVFEDHAAQLLRDEPALLAAFEAWKTVNPTLVWDQRAVLDFIYTNCRRYAEPEWRRYPVLSVF